MNDPISNIYQQMILNESTINKDEQIKKWLEKYTTKQSSIIIDSNGLVSIDGRFDFSNDKRKKIPVQFLKVTECFYTSISITSLAGCPKFVGNNFYCSNNKNLTNLIGGPEEVKGDYCCYYCSNLTSLDGAPEEVGGYFDCNGNKNLTNLKSGLKKVKGDFYCYKCNNLPYSELFKIVDIVDGDIFYTNFYTPEDKDAIRRARDIHINLQHDELGNLDI